MTNLVITPIYKSYEIVKEMADAIEKFTVNPYLHIMVDDDSDCGDFPVKPTPNRRIIMLKRDYSGIIHKNGLGQALQAGYDYAHQEFFNEHANPIPYEHIFIIEADVIVEQDWDQKMIDIIPTLPEDWLTLDQQSVDKEGKTTYPTTVSVRLGFETSDLEIMQYPDYQCCLFNPKIFEAGIRFSNAASHFDITMGRQTEEALKGRHFRTMLVKSMHYTFSSRQFLNETPKE